MTSADDVTVQVKIPAQWAARLEVLIDPAEDLPDLEAVATYLLDWAQRGVIERTTPARGWLCEPFGYDWLPRIERDPDPGRAQHYDRPRRTP